MEQKTIYEELQNRIKKLEQKEAYYRLITENSTDMVSKHDPDGNYTYVSPSCHDLIGYSYSELIGQNAYDFFHPDDIPDIEKSQQKIENKNTTYTVSYRIRHKQGHFLWVETTSKTIKGMCSNEIYEIIATTRDISKRKKSEERFFSMFEHMSSGAAIYEPVNNSKNFIFKAFNHAAEKITIASRKDVIGNNLLDLFPQMNKSALFSALQEVTKSGKEIYLPPFYYEDDFRKGWRENRVYKLPTGEVVALFDDVTERIQAQNELKESEEKYRSMMEAMKNSAYICSSDLVIEYMNPRMISRVGRNATGELCYKAIYGYEEQCSWCLFDSVLKGEHVEYELANPRDNRYYSIINSPIYHSDGTVSKLTMFHDITENKSIEVQLRQARKMESVGTMAGGIAHDFNNILYMITGNAELAMEDIPEWNPVHANLKEIKSAALRAAGIVKQLLNFSRQTDQDFKPIGAITVIKDALKLMRSTIPTSIEIKQSLSSTEVTIHGDSTQINQMIMNLCINASQAMEETGGILDITVEKFNVNKNMSNSYPDLAPGEWLKIKVSDSGPGMNSEIVERIFDPYFTTKEVGKGSGIGLSVVHGIVVNHHGKIFVNSTLGKGATFTIYFPVVTEKPVMDVITPDEIPKGNGEKILFVDDEASIVKMAGNMLERLGYIFKTETNPLDALELFRSKPDAFDLVITDMTMPNLTGVKLIEKLKKIRPDIPVVICTGYSTIIDEEKAISFGIDGYTMKPIVMRDIAITIRDVMDKKESKKL